MRVFKEKSLVQVSNGVEQLDSICFVGVFTMSLDVRFSGKHKPE